MMERCIELGTIADMWSSDDEILSPPLPRASWNSGKFVNHKAGTTEEIIWKVSFGLDVHIFTYTFITFLILS